MANQYFSFKHFTVWHQRCAMKVTTDGCLFGAWVANDLEQKDFQNALDIGAGTGLLSLMVAQKNSLAIDAIELDKDAALQASENVAQSPWSGQINIIEVDLNEYDPSKKYEVIFSNPPFYEHELSSPKAQKNLAHHGTGLTLQQLLAFIITNLAEDGHFYLLLPYKRKEEILSAMADCALQLSEIVTVKPSLTSPPFRLLLKGGKKAQPVAETELSICTKPNVYTSEFTRLLQAYYLYL